MTFPPDTVNPAVERVIERLEAKIAQNHADYTPLSLVRWHRKFHWYITGHSNGLTDAIAILREETT